MIFRKGPADLLAHYTPWREGGHVHMATMMRRKVGVGVGSSIVHLFE